MLNALNDSVPTMSPTSDFLKNEILRVGASDAEVRSALAFVDNEASMSPRAYDALSPRMRRLVDLIGVSGKALPDAILAKPETGLAGN